MIPITANVSNALVRYGQHFGRKPQISDISTKYQDPEDFVRDIDDAIKHKEAIFGGEYGSAKKTAKAATKTAKAATKIQKQIKKEIAETTETKVTQIELLPKQEAKAEEAPVKRKRGRPRKQV